VAVWPDRLESFVHPPPAAVRPWLEMFLEHERRAVAAAIDPSRERLQAALAADPVVPEPLVDRLVAEIRIALDRQASRTAVTDRHTSRRRPDPGRIRVVLQAGGRGERLAPTTDAVPKPLLPVGGVPMVERLLRQLRAAGFRRFTLITGWLGELVESHVRTVAGEDATIDLEVVHEPSPLGNAGALNLLPSDAEPTLLVFADLVTELDFARLLGHHGRSGADVTLASHTEEQRLKLGEIITIGEEVVGYREKPRKSFLICSGVAVLEPEVLRQATTLAPPIGISDLVTKALHADLRVVHWPHGAFWLDVNSLDALERANAACAVHASEAPLGVATLPATARTGRAHE
jgi:NDP-sugar pyrophosphorylase family protein